MNMQQLQRTARNLNKEIENVEDHIQYLERQLRRNIQNFEQGTDAEYRARFGDKIIERIKEEHDAQFNKATEIQRDLFRHLRRINEAITDEEFREYEEKEPELISDNEYEERERERERERQEREREREREQQQRATPNFNAVNIAPSEIRFPQSNKKDTKKQHKKYINKLNNINIF